MKIKYNLNKNYLRSYNEANGVFAMKNILKKKPNKKIRGYIFQVSFPYFLLITFLTILIVLGSFLGIDNYVNYLIDILFVFILFSGILIFTAIFTFISALKYNSKEGYIEIKKTGILDCSQTGIKLEFPYNQITLIVITKNIMVFITESPIMMFIENNQKDEIIEKIKEYSDILIIDKTNNKI